jgi:large conductance mechanosensitive channel
MLKEFKEFAMKGNVLDLAIGVVIGGAFGKIIDSLVTNIITPLIGMILGKVDINSLAFTVGNATVTYGRFLNSILDFVIVAFALFLIVKQINRFKREPAAAAESRDCPFCATSILVKATRCPNCTSDLSGQSVVTGSPAPAATP